MTFEAWRKYLVFSVVAALVPNLVLVLLIVRTFSAPDRSHHGRRRAGRNGEYGTEVDLRASNDEIGLLAESFNE
jgi:hypothetical protein